MSLRLKADSFRMKIKNVRHKLSSSPSEAKSIGIQPNGVQTNEIPSQRFSFQTPCSSPSAGLGNLHINSAEKQDHRPSLRGGKVKESGSGTAYYPNQGFKRKDREDSPAHSGARNTRPTSDISNDRAKKIPKITPWQETLLKDSNCELLEEDNEQAVRLNKEMLENLESLWSAKNDDLYEPEDERPDQPRTWSGIKSTFADRDSDSDLSYYTDKNPIEDHKFKEWSDYDLDLQRKVIEKYNKGDRLWTKRGLRILEDEIKGGNSSIGIPAYAGDGEFVAKEDDLSDHKIVAEFHGYQALACPPATRPDNMPYRSMSLKTIKYDHEDNMAESDRYVWRNCYKRVWRSNPIAFQLYSMFMRLPLPPIDKIICFDFGPIALRCDEPGCMTSRGIYRHLAALTLLECLRKRFGNSVRLLAQDPKYHPDCVRMLPENGFEIVGMHGAAGLAEIDDRTLVFAPNPSFCLKEIVADIAQPAAMFWNTVLTPEEADLKTRSKTAECLNDNILSCYFQYVYFLFHPVFQFSGYTWSNFCIPYLISPVDKPDFPQTIPKPRNLTPMSTLTCQTAHP
ncbi:uncharacterized protein F4807DRAFT_73492 [Annulohypoxylon truncatum]|uniref:uncharacterized protein n=1 Tax=Annulohypoxylon truncatum TaxID=327061 RepID=UPI002008684F|nr:uncharacterized protein F4807DRAFT_73492 [Annulohypoxylon truncatum]KAI1210225.1 hypothetical protein F4807DRAFT_73492 [Annulohypoxylon truncatum]